jgi:hypothetical protein
VLNSHDIRIKRNTAAIYLLRKIKSDQNDVAERQETIIERLGSLGLEDKPYFDGDSLKLNEIDLTIEAKNSPTLWRLATENGNLRMYPIYGDDLEFTADTHGHRSIAIDLRDGQEDFTDNVNARDGGGLRVGQYGFPAGTGNGADSHDGSRAGKGADIILGDVTSMKGGDAYGAGNPGSGGVWSIQAGKGGTVQLGSTASPVIPTTCYLSGAWGTSTYDPVVPTSRGGDIVIQPGHGGIDWTLTHPPARGGELRLRGGEGGQGVSVPYYGALTLERPIEYYSADKVDMIVGANVLTEEEWGSCRIIDAVTNVGAKTLEVPTPDDINNIFSMVPYSSKAVGKSYYVVGAGSTLTFTSASGTTLLGTALRAASTAGTIKYMRMNSQFYAWAD